MVFFKSRPKNNKPIFVYLDEQQVGNYTPTLYQTLANTYSNHMKGTDYLLFFEDTSQAVPAYLSSTMTGTVTIPKKGKVYASYVDANADATTCVTKGYNAQFYDYEINQTDCCELPTGIANAAIPCHVSGACAGNLGTGSSATSSLNFATTARNNGLEVGFTPAGMGATDITNLATNCDVYVLQAQTLINGNQTTLKNTWNGNIGTTSILSGNPNAKIIVQMQTTTSTLQQMQTAWDTLRNATHPPDGLVIFYFTNSTTVSADITQIDSMFTYAENHFNP